MNVRRAKNGPFARIDALLADIAGVALVLMMVLTVGSSVSRYLFAAPIPDVEAIDEMLLVGVVMLPFAYLQLRKGHVEVTVFAERMSPRIQVYLEIFGYLIGAIGFGLLLFGLVRGAWEAWEFSDSYFGIHQIPTWPARTVAALAILAVTIRLVLDLARGLRGLIVKVARER